MSLRLYAVFTTWATAACASTGTSSVRRTGDRGPAPDAELGNGAAREPARLGRLHPPRNQRCVTNQAATARQRRGARQRACHGAITDRRGKLEHRGLGRDHWCRREGRRRNALDRDRLMSTRRAIHPSDHRGSPAASQTAAWLHSISLPEQAPRMLVRLRASSAVSRSLSARTSTVRITGAAASCESEKRPINSPRQENSNELEPI